VCMPRTRETMRMSSKWIPWADALGRQRASAARRKRRAVLAASAALSAAVAGGVAAAPQHTDAATVPAARVVSASSRSCSPKVDYLVYGWTNVCGYGIWFVVPHVREVRQATGPLTRIWLHYGPNGNGALCIYSREDYRVPPKDQDALYILVSLNHSPC